MNNESESDPLLPNADKKKHSAEYDAAGNRVVIPQTFTTFQKNIILAIVCCATFFCFANYSILAPIFPPSALKRGMSQSVIGFAVGIYNLVLCVVAPFLGLYLQHIGFKFTFIAGTMSSAVCSILFGLLDKCPPGTIYIVMNFIVRFFQALGATAFQTASFSIVSHVFKERVTTAFALMDSALTLGIMTGAPLGGLMAQAGGYYLPFTVTGVLLFINGAFGIIFLTSFEDNLSENKDKAKFEKSTFHFLFTPTTLVLVSGMVVMTFSVGFLEPTLANFVDRFGLEKYQVGLLFLAMPMTYALASPFVGIFVDKTGHFMASMIFGALLAGVSYMFMAPAPFFHIKPSVLIYAVISGVAGIFFSPLFVPVMACLLMTARDLGFPDNMTTSGMVSGLAVSATAFGSFLGATVGGVMVHGIGFTYSIFAVGCLFILLGSVLAIFAIVRKVKRPHEKIFDKLRLPESAQQEAATTKTKLMRRMSLNSSMRSSRASVGGY